MRRASYPVVGTFKTGDAHVSPRHPRRSPGRHPGSCGLQVRRHPPAHHVRRHGRRHRHRGRQAGAEDLPAADRAGFEQPPHHRRPRRDVQRERELQPRHHRAHRQHRPQPRERHRRHLQRGRRGRRFERLRHVHRSDQRRGDRHRGAAALRAHPGRRPGDVQRRLHPRAGRGHRRRQQPGDHRDRQRLSAGRPDQPRLRRARVHRSFRELRLPAQQGVDPRAFLPVHGLPVAGRGAVGFPARRHDRGQGVPPRVDRRGQPSGRAAGRGGRRSADRDRHRARPEAQAASTR